MEKAYLIKVDPKHNNNKYYRMEVTGSDLVCTYGRVSEARSQTKTYPASRFNGILKSKLRKGYVDHTELYQDSAVQVKTFKYDNAELQSFYDYLVTKARTSAQSNLSVDLDSLTTAHVDKSLETLNRIVILVNANSIKDANEVLVEQFTIIPRFIDRRAGVSKDLFVDGDAEGNKTKLEKEYDLLDNIKAIVKKPKSVVEEKPNYFLKLIDDKTLFNELVKRYVEGLVSDYKSTQVDSIYEVVTDNDLVSRNNVELHWHGSRTENWNSILTQGLRIKPPGIPTTGSMFGNGIYFAPLSQKSIGYTSYSGSYWARGNSKEALLALYEVELGTPYINELGHSMDVQRITKSHNSLWCYGRDRNRNSRLWNDEIIIPNGNQTKVKYIFKVKG